MADIRATEREFQSLVIQWLHEFLTKGKYSFDAVTGEPTVTAEDSKGHRKRQDPDPVLWNNLETRSAFCWFELKTPATPVDSLEILEKAAEGARKTGAPYFVIWNMRQAQIFKTPDASFPPNKYPSESYGHFSLISSPEDILNPQKRQVLKDAAQKILDDLRVLNIEGSIGKAGGPEATFFVETAHHIVDGLVPLFRMAIEKQRQHEKFRQELAAWVVRQSLTEDTDLIARQMVYRLVARLLFYFMLRRFFADRLPPLKVGGLRFTELEAEIAHCFEEARKVDYQAVFEKDMLDGVPLPKEAGPALEKFIRTLDNYNFIKMPQDVVGAVFEKLIPLHERHNLGQYFTNDRLVDFITAFCVKNKNGYVLDPTCGTGTFLIRAYDRLKTLGAQGHERLLSQIWGIDVALFPSELATINLFRQRIDLYENFPRIVAKDFFEVKPGMEFEFPPPKVDVHNPEARIQIKLPQFDAVVGNFPYIRQELIDKRIKGYKAFLEKTLVEDWHKDYPEFFEANNGSHPKLSGRADIYASLFFHTARFLSEKGRMGIVTSNAWLDADYGYELQKFFLKNFKIIAIVESRCEPWFEDAQVNTVFTILERCLDPKERNGHAVKFVKLKKKLTELIPQDAERDSSERWQALEKYIRSIEHAAGKTELHSSICTEEDDNFRIRLIKQDALLRELEAGGKTAKWGVYLRAPDVYFKIVEACKDKLVPLKDAAKIRYGIKPGITEFFLLDDEAIRYHNIEKKFLRPILTSLKEVNGYAVDEKTVRLKAFVCNLSKAELKKQGYRHALKYIEWGEKQKTHGKARNKPGGEYFPDAPSVKGRERWYELDVDIVGDIVINQMVGKRHGYISNPKKVLANNVFQVAHFHERKNVPFLSAFLNSAFGFMHSEVIGRLTWLQGVLYLYGPEIDALAVPDISKIKSQKIKNIGDKFQSLASTDILPFSKEIKKPERRAFDAAVLEALGLEPSKYLNRLYEDLAELIRERIDLPKAQKALKIAHAQRDMDKIIAQAVGDILPDGPDQFPGNYISADTAMEEIPLPGTALRIIGHGMGLVSLGDEQGWEMEVKGGERARYILYAQAALRREGKDSYVLRMPKADKEVKDSIRRYEEYLAKIRQALEGQFTRSIGDWKRAESVTSSLFREWGVLME